MASQSKVVAELIGTSGQIAADKLAPGAGGTNWTGSVVTASTLAAEVNAGYYLNTTGNSITVTLPTSPSVGNVVSLVDVAAAADSNRITIQPSSGDKINGEVYDMDIDVERGGAQLTYSGANFGWIATEAVNSIEGTARTGKILVESNPVVTSVVNTTDSQAYFQADADEVVLTGRNIKPNSVISFVKATGGAPIDYTVQAGDLNATATQVTFNLPAGMDDDATNDPFDVYVTLPTSLDNPTVPLASPQVNNNLIEWLPTPTFTNAAGSLGFIYSDDVDLSSLSFTSVAATSLDAGDTITYSDDGNLPAGLSVNTTTGTVEGTLSASFGNSGSTVNTFVVTATTTGETGLTKSETRTYSIELRSTKVTDAWIGSDGTTDYDGGSGTTVQVVGYGFDGTDTVATVNFITGGNSYAGTSLTIIDDNNLTINTPQAFTTAQSNLDVEVVLTSGYTYKLSQSTGTTLLTTGSAPTMGTPGTITIASVDRGTAWTAQVPVATDDGTVVSYSATFTPSDNAIDVSGFSIDNSGLISAGTLAADFFAAGGTITAAVTATDNAGNTSSQNYTITVDSTGIYTTEITNSLMFDGSATYLYGTPVGATINTYTVSMWLKRSQITSNHYYFWGVNYNGGSTINSSAFSTNDKIRIYDNAGGVATSYGNRVYRDTSSWIHMVISVNNKTMSFYANNELDFTDSRQSTQFANTDKCVIGAYTGNTNVFNGYLADIYFIDGQALTPSSFGEYATLGTDTYWIPKEYSGTGLSGYGNYGFHLTFESSTLDNPSSGQIQDVSGQGNHAYYFGF